MRVPGARAQAGPRTPAANEIAIIYPAREALLDFLVTTAVDQLVNEGAETRGEPPNEVSEPAADKLAGVPEGTPEVLTVEEAVLRLGASRDQILAEFQRNKIPVRVALAPPSQQRPGKRRRPARTR